MSKSNPVRLWRFGRTGALIFTQKWPNRAKTGVPKNTKKNLWGPTWGVLVIQKIQLTQNNWKIKFIFYGLATRALYFLKNDTKWPFSPSSGKLTHISTFWTYRTDEYVYIYVLRIHTYMHSFWTDLSWSLLCGWWKGKGAQRERGGLWRSSSVCQKTQRGVRVNR